VAAAEGGARGSGHWSWGFLLLFCSSGVVVVVVWFLRDRYGRCWRCCGC
jgi:hypothetical protein